MKNTNIPFLSTRAITLLGAAPAGVAQQCPRCDNSFSEVYLHNFVTLEEAVHGMRNVWSPHSQSCNLGRVAENDGGQDVRVHDMRKLWSPYDL